jgi:hypothetical protein
MSWVKGTRTRLRQMLRRDNAEKRMSEEIRFHIEMETEKNLLERDPGSLLQDEGTQVAQIGDRPSHGKASSGIGWRASIG